MGNNEFVMVPREPTDEMIVAFAEAWYSKRQAIDDPDMLDAYQAMLAAAPSVQHQGEPVAWMLRGHDGVVIEFSLLGAVGRRWVKSGGNVTRLYTSPDTGEVERLSQVICNLNNERDDLGAEVGKLRAENAKLRAGMKGDYDLDAWLAFVKERDALRAQLAETQRISQEEELRANRYSQQLAELENKYRQELADNVTKTVRLAERYSSQLAERDELIALMLERLREAQIFGWDKKVAALSASAEPSTPAEIDERAALPKFAQKVIRKLQRTQECFEDGQGTDIGKEWLDLLCRLGLMNRVQRSPALWEISDEGDALLEARAALERKP